MGQADECYHVGNDDKQHDGDYDECVICLRAEIKRLQASLENLETEGGEMHAEIDRLQALLKEARQYVSDAGNDEDEETQRHSQALLSGDRPMSDIVERAHAFLALRDNTPFIEADALIGDLVAEIKQLRAELKLQDADREELAIRRDVKP